MSQNKVDGVDEMHPDQLRRRLEKQSFGGKSRMSAEVAVFAEAFELPACNLADRLSVVGGVLQNLPFELQQLPDVADSGRVVP